MTPLLNAQSLMDLATRTSAADPACQCMARDLTGWEGWPATFLESSFTRIATLAEHPEEDATLEEFHPAGTSYWSFDAPIAPRYYPYNQCSVWACTHCERLYLRHDDHGAYHCEPRIRRVSAQWVVDAAHGHDGRDAS